MILLLLKINLISYKKISQNIVSLFKKVLKKEKYFLYKLKEKINQKKTYVILEPSPTHISCIVLNV